MNKTTTRRFMAWILTVAMLIGMLPMNALASDNPKDDSQSVFMGSFLDPDQSKGGAGSKGITPPQNTYTYIFKVDDEEEVERQSVKDGEYLIEPEAPVKPNHKFKGWFVGSNQIDFSQPISVPQEVPPVNTNIVANAKFEEVYYVFFMDGVGGEGEPNPRVFKTKEGKTGDTVTTSDVKLPIGSTQAVTGWYKDQALTDGPVGTNYTIGTANQILWPKIETGNYLYFVSGENGTYIEPQFFLPGENTVAPNPPTRPGYDFSHWSTTQGGSAYTFGQPIIADVTLYAVWTAKNNTPYTVVFWKQSVNDDKNAADDVKTYDYAESVARTAATGATVSPTTADGNKNYQGFHYNSAKSTSVTVKGDGTTILNVYYDRNLLTIDFHKEIPAVLDYNDVKIINAGNTQPATPEGYQYWKRERTSWVPARWDYYFAKIITPASDGFKYTGLYGQTLAQNGYTWPKEDKWTSGPSGGNTLTFLDAFIFDNLPAYGSTTYINVYSQTLSGSAEIIHYKEALNGTWVEANSMQTSGGTFNFSNKYTGFTVAYYRTGGSGSWKATSPGGSANYSSLLEVRHTRNSYNLAFYNYNEVARTENLKFEASLSSYDSYEPSKPAELPDVYIFQGWYKDNAYSVPFNFATETMPSNDLMIYVKWAPPVFDGTFHVQMSGDDTPKEVTVTYNDTIDPATMPTVKDHEGNVLSQGDDGYTVTVPKDHKWIGWATKVDGNYITYNFNTLVQSDIELYPYYVDNAQFKVSYDAGSGTGTPPEDTKKYAKDTYADVMSPTDLTPPTGKVFLGWENKGVIYQPGDKIRVTGPMTLTAQWGVVPKKVDLVYNYNYGTNPATKTFGPFPVNSTVIVKELGDSDLGGWVAPENYEFVGWNTEADGSGTSFAAGDSAMIDAKNPNELYAIWAPVLTVTSGDGTWQYDGNSHTYQQYDLVYGDQTITGGEGELSFMLNDGKTVTITPEGKGADGVKTVSDNSDNNNTFSVEVDTSVPQGTHVSGTLTITPVTDKVTVTITENSGSFMYDGSLKTVNGYEVTSISNPLYTEADFTFSGTDSVSGTNAGIYDMELVPANFTNNNTSFTDVEFVIVDGTLKVTKAPVTIKTGSAEKEYDGSPLTNATVNIEGLVDGESVTLAATGSQTEVGSSDNTYTIEWDNASVANYTVTEELGTLTVTTNATTEVKLIAADAEKVYDGTALTKTDGVTWSGLPAGFTVEATSAGSQTNAGESANVVSDGYVIKDGNGNDKTANFTNVTKVPGTLKVTKAPVTIKTGSAEKEYDGTALTESTVDIEGLVDGESVTLATTGSQTEVGSSDNTYTIEWDNASASNYTVTEELGTLTVTTDSTTEVKLIAADAEKVYDGTALTKTDGVTWSGLPAGFTVEATSAGSQTNAGESANVVSDGYVIKDGNGNDKTANFTNVTKVPGTLKVTKAPVTIKTGSAEKEYDGTALTESTVDIEGLVDGESVTLATTGSQTEVGSSDNTYTIEWDNASASNYTVTEELGTLTVTTNSTTEVKLIAADAEKVYDGTALTKTDGVTWSGLPAGFTVEATSAGSQTNAGESANVVSDGYVIKDGNGNDKTANFTNVTKVPGTLKVTKAPVTIKTGSAEKEYDGSPLTNATVNIEGLVDGESVTLAATGSQTEVGSSDNTYTIEWDNASASNYTVTEELGTLTVTTNSTTEVKLIAADAEKVYDGTALTKTDGVTWSGLPAGFTVEATSAGSQTNAGESANVVSDGYVIKDGNGNDKTANFTNVTKVPGTLKVTKAPVTIKTGSAEKEYDGSPLTNATVNIEGLVDGESVTLAATGSQTEVGSSDNTYTIEWDNASVANYTVTEELGTLTVTTNSTTEVKLIAADAEKVYDGTALTKTDGVTWSGLPAGFTVEATSAGSQTNAGESANVVSDGYVIKDGNGNDKTANFTNVTKVPGTLKVTKAPVTIKTGSAEKEYDGSPLTNATVNIEGLVDGESVTLAATGSQTEVGSSDNTYTIEWDNASASNYTVTEELGTLTVTTNSTTEVKLIAADAEKVYDGTALTKTDGVTWSGLPAGFTVEATSAGSQTNAGESANVVSDGYVIKDGNGNDKTANFTNVTKVPGTLKVTKAPVTIKTGSAEKEYDGTALTESTVDIEGLVDGESVTLATTGSQTEIGSSDNTYTIEWDNASASNYTVTEELGTLTVTTNSTTEVKLIAADAEKVYDGTALTKTDGVTWSGLPAGFTVEATSAGSQTNAGESANVVSDGYVIKDGNGNDKTANFTNVTKVPGTLKVTKAPVTIKTGSAEKEYDGTALTESTVDIEGLVDGESVTLATTGSQTEIGSSDNTYTIEWDNASAANYTVTEELGTLTVTALDDEVVVTITENSGTELYDGTAKTVTGYTVTSISNTLYTAADFSFSGTDSVSGTNAGTYNMALVPGDFTNTNTNFTNVTFVIVDGALTITKRQVTLTSADDSKVYDGDPLTNDTVDVTGDGWANGEGATYNVTGSQTDAGSSDNTFTYTLNEGTLAANYDIATVEGKLTVTALDDEVVVTITENSGTELYDGTAKTVNGYEVTSISNTLYTAADFSFSGTDSVSGTNAGVYNMELKPEDFANTSANFTNVTFVIVDGALTITKRQVTLTSADDSKVYDGTALINDTVDVTGDGWANGEGATYNVTGSQTDAGSSDNTFTYTLNEGTLAANYDIATVEGKLTVTALDDEVVVTITENSGTELYDGTAKTVNGYEVTSISNTLYTAADFSFSGTDSVSGTNAGTYNMALAPGDFTNTNTNFTNVTFVIVDGTLTITKRQVTLTSADDSKVYDGTALINDTVDVTGDGWANGEGATYNVTGSQTDAGSSDNTFTYTLNEGTLAANYDIATVEGKLTVTALDDEVVVTITENSGTELYDGSEKTVTGYEVTSISNPLYTTSDFTFSGTASVSGTNAGTYDMELKPADFTNNSANFTNVTFVIVDGTLTITKRQVTLTSADDSKVYDGTELTNDTVDVTGDGWANGEGATYNVTGSQTDAGSSDNTFTYTLNDGTLAANYDIATVEGTLTITPVTDEVVVMITEKSGLYKYDGAEKTVTGYTVAISNPLYTEADFTFTGDATVKGTNAGVYNMELKPEDFANTSVNFTNVKFLIFDGTLEITKREVTLTSATDSKVYDGTELTNDTVEVTGEGWADGEGATYDVTGSQLDVGTSDNEFDYTLDSGTLADNYDIFVVFGTLTVTPVTDEVVVTITENSGTELYDGAEETVTGYVVTNISNLLYTEADFTFSGTASVSGTNAGVYNMELKPEDFANDSANFTNVTFVIVDGTLTITKRQVMLTSASARKEYDGTALRNRNVIVGGDGWAAGEGATYNVTGAQLNVGTRYNTFTYALRAGTLAANYDIMKVEGTLTVTPLAVPNFDLGVVPSNVADCLE